MQISIKWKLQGNLDITGTSQKYIVFILSNIVIINLRYLSQRLSVCSCIKWLVHQMSSTQVLRRVVYSAEILPDCPLSKIIRIIGIKTELNWTEWRVNKSIYFWLRHSLEHRNGSNNANSALKHMYKPVEIFFKKNVLLIYKSALEGRESWNKLFNTKKAMEKGHSKSWQDKSLLQQTNQYQFR